MAAANQQTTKKAPTAWQAYQAAVLARPDLTSRDQLAFRDLASFADYKTTPGANCVPSMVDLTERYGRPGRWYARRFRQLRALGIINVIPLRTCAGRWNRNGYQFIGHGFTGPIKFDKLKWLKPSRSPRRGNVARDRATGRFTLAASSATPMDQKWPLDNGPKVAIGASTEWTKSGQSDLALEADPALDLAVSATATGPAKPSGDNKPVGTYSELDRKASDKDDEFERWRRQLDTQLGENAVTEPVIPNGGG